MSADSDERRLIDRFNVVEEKLQEVQALADAHRRMLLVPIDWETPATKAGWVDAETVDLLVAALIECQHATRLSDSCEDEIQKARDQADAALVALKKFRDAP